MSDGPRLKCDMCPPQPTEHPDPRMRLVLQDLYRHSEHPRTTYALSFSGKRKDTDLPSVSSR